MAWRLIDDRQRDEGEEQRLQPLDAKPRGGGAERVERGVQELLPEDGDRGEDERSRADDQGDQVLDARREQLPEQEAEQIGHVALDRAVQEHAEGERPGEQHADGRVRPDPRAARDEPIASAVPTAAIAPPR